MGINTGIFRDTVQAKTKQCLRAQVSLGLCAALLAKAEPHFVKETFVLYAHLTRICVFINLSMPDITVSGFRLMDPDVFSPGFRLERGILRLTVEADTPGC